MNWEFPASVWLNSEPQNNIAGLDIMKTEKIDMEIAKVPYSRNSKCTTN